MQWWYEQPDGAGALFGVTYADTGCGGAMLTHATSATTDTAGRAPSMSLQLARSAMAASKRKRHSA